MLCDDHELVRSGLIGILDGVGGITVVAGGGALRLDHPEPETRLRTVGDELRVPLRRSA